MTASRIRKGLNINFASADVKKKNTFIDNINCITKQSFLERNRKLDYSRKPKPK